MINVNVKKENSGMSLVELIIVIAIIGILAGVSIGMMGHIHYADTKKAVETIDAELDRLRIFSMSKKEIPYLYIYQLDDGCYMRELNEEIWNFDAAKFTKDGTKIAGKDVSVYMEAKDGTLLARAIQHENDHLDGVLFIDHCINRFETEEILKKHKLPNLDPDKLIEEKNLEEELEKND